MALELSRHQEALAMATEVRIIQLNDTTKSISI